MKAAYSRLARMYHPDKAGAAFTDTFNRIQHIYEALQQKPSLKSATFASFPFPGDAPQPPPGRAGPEPGAVVTVLWDHVDVANLEFFASMPAAARIVLDDEVTCRETLRSRAYLDLQRHQSALDSKRQGMLVSYHEDRLFEHTQVPGRLVSGMSDVKHATGFPWLEQIQKLEAMGLSTWQATRGLQAGPKFYKELARGSRRVLDADRQKSFPNAVLDRYPDLEIVELWCRSPEEFASRCGFAPPLSPAQYKHVKSFCNSAAGTPIAIAISTAIAIAIATATATAIATATATAPPFAFQMLLFWAVL